LGERRDVGTPDPIDPDEAGKRVFALGGAIFILSITESGTSSPAVMGMSRGVAAEFLEPEGFFGKGVLAPVRKGAKMAGYKRGHVGRWA